MRPRYHTSKDPDAQLRQTKSQLENMGALVQKHPIFNEAILTDTASYMFPRCICLQTLKRSWTGQILRAMRKQSSM